MRRVFALTAVAFAIATAPPARAQSPAHVAPDADEFGIKVKVDEFEKTRTTTMRIAHHGTDADYRIEPVCYPSGDISSVILLKSEAPGSPTVFGIYTEYEASKWMYIGERPLQVLADGALLQLAPTGSPARNVVRADHLIETQAFLATPAQLHQLAAAKALKVRLLGTQGGNCVFTLPTTSMAALRQFVAREVP
jgi:hypothetical protein